MDVSHVIYKGNGSTVRTKKEENDLIGVLQELLTEVKTCRVLVEGMACSEVTKLVLLSLSKIMLLCLCELSHCSIICP